MRKIKNKQVRTIFGIKIKKKIFIVLKIVSLGSFGNLLGCSVGTWWKSEKEVERLKEIPLSCVPWISKDQQQEEGKNILPCYFTLKQRQECAQKQLNYQFNQLNFSSSCK
ncbi:MULTISPECIES: hypothetical protein [Holospora]|uniref:Uncharacterized protein n=2 Tax=Holospora TaxID=44747 RepID=A0A061JH01_9PROT|nr:MULTISPECIES: hypothetical protein [Holospora]ETZ05441.1 hypothetical protein K737_300122 [Holospora undulata HU1]GAJ46391.1 hypothetical protein HE1_00724 [Holospora elegans E1]